MHHLPKTKNKFISMPAARPFAFPSSYYILPSEPSLPLLSLSLRLYVVVLNPDHICQSWLYWSFGSSYLAFCCHHTTGPCRFNVWLRYVFNLLCLISFIADI